MTTQTRLGDKLKLRMARTEIKRLEAALEYERAGCQERIAAQDAELIQLRQRLHIVGGGLECVHRGLLAPDSPVVAQILYGADDAQ